jgi:lipopolysaccharide export system protein LptA
MQRVSSKFRAFMKIPLLLPCLVLALASGVAPALAEKADRNKPMNIEADALRYDDVKQTSVFSGRVVLTKGSIIIRGGRVEVHQDPEGFQFGLVTGSGEAPAFFRQKRDGVDEFIEGEGVSIEYDGRADAVRFIQKAQLRRYRGATVADEISGALIVYDNQHDKFSVDGVANPASAGASPGRVRAMLTPKPDDTAVPGAQAAPALRATPALGGAAK